MKLRGVQLRLTIWYMLLLAIILAVFNAIVYFSLDYNLYDRASKEVERHATLAAQAATLYGDTIYIDDAKLPADPFWGSSYVGVINAGGAEIQKLPQIKLGAPPKAATEGVQTGKPKQDTAQTPQGKVRYSIKPIKNTDGVVVGAVLVAKPLAQTEDTLHQLRLMLLLGSGVALLLAFACGQFLAWLSLRPVRQAFQRQRDFVADASHELRTPLALIRANTEALLRRFRSLSPEAQGYASEVLEEVDHLNRIVGDLATLALADAQQQRLQREPMDLRELLQDLVRQVAPLAAERGIAIRADLAEPAAVEADAGRLRQLFLILLDNALTYTPAGGTLSLSLRNGDQRAEVCLSDSGPGIPEKDLPHVWERFYRVDKARTRHATMGTGLGLAIARWIVTAHHAQIRLESRPGGGTTAVVVFPAARAPSALQEAAAATTS